ncbi:MAG: phosphomethylpyrimidine synthase ThiC [Clostridiales bacterium]|nr:phosphomethylpyrimidine synthase ThiC [Clostridiales bacterium]
MKIVIGNVKREKKLLAGDGQYPRVLASVGISREEDCIQTEVQKAKLAQKYGADIVIDHTLTPKNYDVQKQIIEETDIPVSSIAVYDVAAKARYGERDCFTETDVLNGIEQKAKLGIDMMTIHASCLKKDLLYFEKSNRVIPCTSRGGTMVLENIQKTGCENFYFTYFDKILEIAKAYGVTLSLGAVYRPANIYDAVHENTMYWEEIRRNADLVAMAKEKGVACIVEGIGHCPVNLIPEVVKKSKAVCKAPYRVLTVSTDSALGFDHVSSAIAAATAVAAGADFVTAVSRSEHLGLPSHDDLKEAVISAKIAAHSGYIARTGDIGLDYSMAKERSIVGCRGTMQAAIVPEMTKEALQRYKADETKKCTMCGDFCALFASDNIRGKNARKD